METCVHRAYIVAFSLACAACVDDPSSVDQDTSAGTDDLPSLIELQVEIEIEPDDWNHLATQGANFLDNLTGPDCLSAPFTNTYTWYPATVTVGGERVEQMGVRKKGFLGSNSWERPSLKLDSDRFVDDQRLIDGTEHFTLNNMQQDPSRIRTCLAYAVFSRAGTPAPACDFATVAVNGEDLGVYASVQPVKKAFLREHFGDDDGDLYEGTISDFTEEYVVTFEAKTDETDPELGPLHALTEALQAEDDDLMVALEAVLDVDAYITMWAVESLIGHWDGYAQGRNNFYIYRSPEDDRLHFIPWGADAVFEWAQGDPVHTMSTLSGRLWDHPTSRAAYLAESQRLLDEVWDEDWLFEEMARMTDLVLPDVRSPDAFRDTMGFTEAFIDGGAQQSRRAVIQDMLDSGGPDRPFVDEPKICMEAFADVHAEFSLEWGSLDVDPFQADADLSIDFYDWQAEFLFEGGMAGEDAGVNVILLTGLELSGTDFTYAALILPDSTEPGTHAVDLSQITGVMATLDLTTGEEEGTPWGYISGEVVFDEIGFEPGAPIRGRLDGVVVPAFFELFVDGSGAAEALGGT